MIILLYRIIPDLSAPFLKNNSDNLPYEKVGNNEPVCIADEVPFEIPDSWEWCRLGSILNKLSDGTHSTPQYFESGVPFISVKDISSGYLDFSRCKYISKDKHKELYERCNPECGDILLTKVGTTGIPVIVDTDAEFSLFVSVALLKFNQHLLYNEYLIHLINSPLVQKQATENTKGVGNKNWVMRDITHTLIVIPPLKEQYQIVDKLKEYNRFLSEYNRKEIELSNLNSCFPDLLKKSILQEAVQGKLVPQDKNDEPAAILLERIRAEKQQLIKAGKIKKDKHESVIYKRDNSHYELQDGVERCIDDEIPFEILDNWCWCRLGSIGDWGSGATPSRTHPEYYDGSIPWLKTGDLTDSYIIDIPEGISQLALEKTSVRLNESGSVLMAMYGATIGKLGILTFPATTNQACCACKPVWGVETLYLFYFLMSQRTAFIKRGEGGAQPNISKEKIVSTLMPLPPLAEQQRIVRQIDKIMPIIDNLSK